MRKLILNEMKQILTGTSAQEMRWQQFATYAYMSVLKKDPTTKSGKKEMKYLDLGTVDYDVLSDEDLLYAFEFVIRKYYAQF